MDSKVGSPTEASAAPAQARLKVGEWNVEPDLNQLSRPGKAVRVEPRVMALLLYLASRSGRVATREELLSAIWPGVVVTDDSLTQAINKLRKALDDDTDKPAYVQTIPKKGYRLIATVAPLSPASPSRRTWRREAAYLTAAVAVAALATAGLWSRGGPQVEPSSASRQVFESSELPTIAIAPFEVLGKERRELLLARGLAADLATDLSKLSGLSVLGFAPMEGHPETDASIRRSARYVVSGTVQSIDKRVRLHVYLTEQSTGRQLWSERFERAEADLFAIQDELAPRIVALLPAKLSEAELRRMARRHTRNLQAYEHFLRGQAALLVRDGADNDLAKQMFRRAIELDANFARAYSGLALAYAADYRHGWTHDKAGALERAFELAGTANEINPDIPETYWALAYVHAQRRQHEEALGYLEKSVSLYPSFADGYALMASIKTFAGRPTETVKLMRRAMRLNPKSGYLYFLVLGRAYYFLGDLEQAGVNLKEAMKRNPEYLETHIYMAALTLEQRDRASAAWEADQIRALDRNFQSRRWLDSYPMTDSRQTTRLQKVFDELGV